MNHYHIWFDLKDTRQDLQFCQNLTAFLGHLKSEQRIASYRLTRRKFGFGLPELGEFHCDIETESLAQLDSAFDVMARRSGELEVLHAKVFSMVTNFRSALYRDFPDPQRVIPPTG